MPQLAVSVEYDAPPERVWAAVTDWAGQARWVPFTRVRGDAGGDRVGARIEAWTGVGPVGFLDPMEVTVWDPPRRCEVRHLGRVVRGTGAYEVAPLPGGRSRFTWVEWLDLPLGAVGQVGFALLTPLLTASLRLSLRRLERLL